MKLTTYFIMGAAAFFIGVIGITLLVFVLLFGSGDDSQAASGLIEGDGIPLSNDVTRYEKVFKKYAKENDIADQVDVLMALTMQESGGTALDVMQSSESQGRSPDTITDPKKSIKVGVAYYAGLYKETGGKTKLTLQAYNMGGGFINYAKKHNGGKYSQKLAQEFSDRQKEKLNKAVYGDPLYVQHVTQYLETSSKTKFQGGKWGAPLQRDLAITSGYGGRADPMGGNSNFHYGIDFACSPPDKVLAVHDGVVYKTGFDSGGWGNHIIIKNSDNELSVVGHLSNIKAQTGDKVKKGQQIGVCGSTGAATGPHVHLEYWKSKKGGADRTYRKNPEKMLHIKGGK